MLRRAIHSATAFLAAVVACLASPARAIGIWWNPADLEGFTCTDNWSALLRLTSDSAPVSGYSLEIEVVPLPGTSGSVTVNAVATGFYDLQNLITAGGLERDPARSGIFLSPERVLGFARTIDDVLVAPVPGINDVLLDLHLLPSPGSFGDFELRFGPATAFYGAGGASVPFDAQSAILHVVPAPTTCVIGALLLLPLRRR